MVVSTSHALGPARVQSARERACVTPKNVSLHTSGTVTEAPGGMFDHATSLRGPGTLPSDLYFVMEQPTLEQIAVHVNGGGGRG
jgi:hypothetical protein